MWDSARVEAIYRALNSLIPSLPELTGRVVPTAEFHRHLFKVQACRQRADHALLKVTQKHGEAKRSVELLKQSLRLAEVWAEESPSVMTAKTVAQRRRLIEQETHKERTALALSIANLRRVESVLSAAKSVVESLENARITINSAVNAAVAEMNLSRSKF